MSPSDFARGQVAACEIAGIEMRALQRSKDNAGIAAGYGRPQAVRPTPTHALSDVERAEFAPLLA